MCVCVCVSLCVLKHVIGTRHAIIVFSISVQFNFRYSRFGKSYFLFSKKHNILLTHNAIYLRLVFFPAKPFNFPPPSSAPLLSPLFPLPIPSPSHTRPTGLTVTVQIAHILSTRYCLLRIFFLPLHITHLPPPSPHSSSPPSTHQTGQAKPSPRPSTHAKSVCHWMLCFPLSNSQPTSQPASYQSISNTALPFRSDFLRVPTRWNKTSGFFRLMGIFLNTDNNLLLCNSLTLSLSLSISNLQAKEREREREREIIHHTYDSILIITHELNSSGDQCLLLLASSCAAEIWLRQAHPQEALAHLHSLHRLYIKYQASKICRQVHLPR